MGDQNNQAGQAVALSDEEIDATWDSFPTAKVCNEARKTGLRIEVAIRRAFARALLAKADHIPDVAKWHVGEPPKPQREEWFIAETIHGDRVVLTALPEEFAYDYKTADDSYLKAQNIRRWMQFPDCEYAPPATPPAADAGQDFDAWMANPYTKVLQESIRNDYVPRADARQEDGGALSDDAVMRCAKAVIAHWAEFGPEADFSRAVDALESALSRVSSSRADVESAKWVPVSARLPEAGLMVLAFYVNGAGKPRRIRAKYIADRTCESTDFDGDIGAVYDEASDTYYWPAGWYEQIDNLDDYSAVAVCEGEVTHWMPMPDGPLAAAEAPKGE